MPFTSLHRRIARLFFFCFAFQLAPFSAGQENPPSGWSFELGEAFAAYHSGHFAEAAEICRGIAASTRNDNLRRDAETLSAMASMRMPSRDECTSGRTRLGQVVRGAPHIVERPDCRFAIGTARLTLNELSSSLGELSSALEAFEREKRTARVLDAFVALADCWSRFNEWGLPVRGLALTPPESPAAAAKERNARVAEIRLKAEALPGSEVAVQRIDLIQARQMLASPETRSAGIERIRSLASSIYVEIACDAAMILAEQLTQDGVGTEEILALYKRVAAANLGEKSRVAMRAAEELLRRRVEFEFPAAATAGAPILLGASIANYSKVLIEVRRFDAARFLLENKGSMIESQLPDDGAIVAQGELTASADQKGPQWSGRMQLNLPVGSFVIAARDSAAPTGPAIAKAPLLVGALDAAVIVGNQLGLVAVDSPGPCKARFWMHGSYQPYEITVTAGCGNFALPPESRLVRDRRWVCLIESEKGGIALCRGALPELPLPANGGAGVLAMAAPESPRAAEEVVVTGWLAEGLPPGTAPLRLEIELRDTMDELRDKAIVSVDSTGAFSARFRAAAEWAGSVIHPVIRHQNSVLPCLYRVPLIRLAGKPDLDLLVDVELGLLGVPQEGLLRGNLKARYPWGLPLSNGRADINFRAIRLPDPEQMQARAPTAPLRLRSRMDAEGRASFGQPTADFKLEPGKIGLHTAINVQRPDQGMTTVEMDRLFSDEAAHVWIESPQGGIRTGEASRLRVGWFDPAQQLGGVRPTLEVMSPGDSEWRESPLFPDRGGFWATDWCPLIPGTHVVRARLPRGDGSWQETIANLPVELGQNRGPARIESIAVRVERSEADSDTVQLEVRGSSSAPILAVVTTRQPLAAQWVRLGSEITSTRISVKGLPVSGARVCLFSFVEGELKLLGSVWLPGDPASTLELASVGATPAVGTMAQFEVKSRSVNLRGATLIARLYDATDIGSVDWLISEREMTSDVAKSPMVTGSSSGKTASQAAAIPSVEPISAAMTDILSRGANIWTEVDRGAADKVVLSVPMPTRCGKFRLSVAAQWRDGRQATATLPIDLSDRIGVTADFPTMLCAGDRTIASVRLHNTASTARAIRLRTISGAGMTAGAWKVVQGSRVENLRTDADAMLFDLPPRAEVIFSTDVEAARIGRFAFQANVESNGAVDRIEQHYRVFSATERATTAPSAEPIHIDRKIWRVDTSKLSQDEDPTAAVVNLVPKSLYAAPRSVLLELEAVPLGTVLMIEDSVQVPAAIHELMWTQRAPSLTAMRKDVDKAVQSIAPELNLTNSEAVYVADSIPPGKYTHRFLLTVRRPGTCLIPEPSIRAKSGSLPAIVNPSDVRIRVAE